MSNRNSELLSKLNLTRINEENVIADSVIKVVDPRDLLNSKRFDIMAKFIYGFFLKNNIKSDWGYRLYEDHLWVFNRYDEDDGSGKKGIKSFIDSYNKTFLSIKEEGFNDNLSVIPIDEDNVPLDGAHRVAASLLFDKRIKVLTIKGLETNYNYEFFEKKGLQHKWSDAIAYEYCKLKGNVSILTMFSNVYKEKEELYRIIKEYGDIYYERELNISNIGLDNLLSQLEISDRPRKSAKGGQTITIILIESMKVNLDELKCSIKNITEKSIHVSTSRKEVLNLAKLFFNTNSVEFFNRTNYRTYNDFEYKLKNVISKDIVSKDRYCIIDETLFSKKACNTILLNFDQRSIEVLQEDLREKVPLKKLNKIDKLMDDIIFNPEYHFYYKGIKFATYASIKKMKNYAFLYSLVDKFRFRGLKQVRYNLTKKIRLARLKMVTIKNKYNLL
ncbi:hypothetical protein LF817_01730 [Halobacillus sp. A1]|uniref:hypothetical protein n=1 Tax=Halobacillus sp. A1 TaxID=2880262 RepID=UPI0020A6D50E|nr:hypothetical protein [Halobacillus sp. A1]MCP3030054.1 hypothetical protein [Halobacillus sp. A1]